MGYSYSDRPGLTSTSLLPILIHRNCCPEWLALLSTPTVLAENINILLGSEVRLDQTSCIQIRPCYKANRYQVKKTAIGLKTIAGSFTREQLMSAKKNFVTF